MINPVLYNPRKKQRSLWIEDKIWEMILSMKKENQSISCSRQERGS
jgi:hypothetical protein